MNSTGVVLEKGKGREEEKGRGGELKDKNKKTGPIEGWNTSDLAEMLTLKMYD